MVYPVQKRMAGDAKILEKIKLYYYNLLYKVKGELNGLSTKV